MGLHNKFPACISELVLEYILNPWNSFSWSSFPFSLSVGGCHRVDFTGSRRLLVVSTDFLKDEIVLSVPTPRAALLTFIKCVSSSYPVQSELITRSSGKRSGRLESEVERGKLVFAALHEKALLTACKCCIIHIFLIKMNNIYILRKYKLWHI